jgi:hypothetical protein
MNTHPCHILCIISSRNKVMFACHMFVFGQGGHEQRRGEDESTCCGIQGSLLGPALYSGTTDLITAFRDEGGIFYI